MEDVGGIAGCEGAWGGAVRCVGGGTVCGVAGGVEGVGPDLVRHMGNITNYTSHTTTFYSRIVKLLSTVSATEIAKLRTDVCLHKTEEKPPVPTNNKPAHKSDNFSGECTTI